MYRIINLVLSSFGFPLEWFQVSVRDQDRCGRADFIGSAKDLPLYSSMHFTRMSYGIEVRWYETGRSTEEWLYCEKHGLQDSCSPFAQWPCLGFSLETGKIIQAGKTCAACLVEEYKRQGAIWTSSYPQFEDDPENLKLNTVGGIYSDGEYKKIETVGAKRLREKLLSLLTRRAEQVGEGIPRLQREAEEWLFS